MVASVTLLRESRGISCLTHSGSVSRLLSAAGPGSMSGEAALPPTPVFWQRFAVGASRGPQQYRKREHQLAVIGYDDVSVERCHELRQRVLRLGQAPTCVGGNIGRRRHTAAFSDEREEGRFVDERPVQTSSRNLGEQAEKCLQGTGSEPNPHLPAIGNFYVKIGGRQARQRRLGRMSMILQMMPNMISSAPPPMEATRESR